MATARRSKHTVRIAALADIHYSRASSGSLQSLFLEINESADVLLLCGDLTDYGQPEEAHILVKDLRGGVKIPVLAVLGNHDFESGKQDEIRQIASEAGVTVLDGETCEVHGIGFAGVKGFGGGFGQYMLSPWGEEMTKRFVAEAVEDALRLEAALAKLSQPQRIALLHYAPIRSTVEGESPEIYPFVGCSRLEEPLNRYQVLAAFHGHAHNGAPQGETSANIPIYNVSLSVLRRAFPDRPPFCLYEAAVDS